jgi:hypothetical protein
MKMGGVVFAPDVGDTHIEIVGAFDEGRVSMERSIGRQLYRNVSVAARTQDRSDPCLSTMSQKNRV